MLLGLIHRQIMNVNLDPYANAYNYGPTGSPWDNDITTKLNSSG
jgi:meiotically up-regulated gene 157 (Mug157) protein